jgi:hypothetical protein
MHGCVWPRGVVFGHGVRIIKSRGSVESVPKRQRAGALQDASRISEAVRVGVSLLEGGSLLPLSHVRHHYSSTRSNFLATFAVIYRVRTA